MNLNEIHTTFSLRIFIKTEKYALRNFYPESSSGLSSIRSTKQTGTSEKQLEYWASNPQP